MRVALQAVDERDHAVRSDRVEEPRDVVEQTEQAECSDDERHGRKERKQ